MMTLLETLVAMALLSILLVFFFGIFRELAYIQDEDQKDYKTIFYENYAQLRLNYLFSHVHNENNTNKHLFDFYSKSSDSFSSSPSLVLIYNNGVRQNPFLSGYIKARLYVDDDTNELRLVNWPLNLQNPHPYFFRETLMPDVESIRFEFLAGHPDNRLRGSLKSSLSAGGQWLHTWEKNYHEMPVVVRIYIKVKGVSQEKTYTYVLPNHRYGITYLKAI